MSKPEPFVLRSGDGVHLGLHRFGNGGPGHTPVLLLHGASANHRTFITPSRTGGLAAFLQSHGFDPWMLDWRGSGLVVEDERNQKLLAERGELFTFNEAAKLDVTAAIERVLDVTKASSVGAVGFCMGSAVLAESIALGHAAGLIDHLVLMTLGLFYETPIDGRVKSDQHLLERLARTGVHACGPVLTVDPRVTPWPQALEDLYGKWPSALKSHDELEQPVELSPGEVVSRMCNRLSFMYGMPYNHRNLVDEIHAIEDDRPVLRDLFGGIPLQMYIHGGKNIRHGQATDAAGAIPSEMFVSDQARDRFRALKKVALITGAVNRLWHRDSIDRMHEWLGRGSSEFLSRFTKRVIPQYGHQDLLWGPQSECDVYPFVRDALR